MLEQEQLIGNAIGLARLDELLLEFQRIGVLDRSETPDLYHTPSHVSHSSTFRDGTGTRRVDQSHASSNPSSRSLTKARNLPASAPSMSR